MRTFIGVTKLLIYTYTTLIVDSSFLNANEDNQFTNIGNDSDLSTVTSFFSFAIKFEKGKFYYAAVLQVPLSVWKVLFKYDIRSSGGMFFSTYFSRTVRSYMDITELGISTYFSRTVRSYTDIQS